MIAKPLPTRDTQTTKSKKEQQSKKSKHKKSSGNDYQDDTPKEFARLMRNFQQSAAPGSKRPTDADTEKPNRKRKRGEQDDNNGKQRREPKSAKTDQTTASTTASTTEALIPKILPGERLADFSARVDHALPLSEISKKSGTVAMTGNAKVDAAIRNMREERQTKHERRLRRLQKEWREEEAKIREREEAEREEKEAEDEEVNDLWREWGVEAGGAKKGKKKKSKKGKNKKKGAGDGGDFDDGEEDDGDPWAKLNQTKRAAGRSSNPFDVVQAPPEKLTKVREKFKVRGMDGARVEVADVPTAAGSLRRREELASERQSIVDEYRRIMANKRGQ